MNILITCIFHILAIELQTMVRSILELTLATDRSSDQRCSVKSFLTNFAKLTGKHLCQCHFFNKVAGLRPATLLKKETGTGVYLSILREHFFYKTPSDDCFWTEYFARFQKTITLRKCTQVLPPSYDLKLLLPTLTTSCHEMVDLIQSN